MKLNVQTEVSPRWMDSEIESLRGDVQWLIRPLTLSRIRIIKEKAKKNPNARRQRVTDDEGTLIVLDGNELDAITAELADYALADWKGVCLEGEEIGIDETMKDQTGRTVTIKSIVLDNIDITNEVVRFARLAGGFAQEEAEKNS